MIEVMIEALKEYQRAVEELLNDKKKLATALEYSFAFGKVMLKLVEFCEQQGILDEFKKSLTKEDIVILGRF
jgi:hypothetical protein